MQQTCKLILALAILTATVLSGCSSKQIAPLKVYWPPPPSEPKMEWITTFSSEDNFPKTEGQVMAEKFLGKKSLNFFHKPMGITADSAGLVYVADLDLGNIRVIDFNNKTMNLYAEKSSTGLPLGLLFDNQGLLYVSDSYGKQILVYNPQHELVGSFGKGLLIKPTFLALDEGRGRLYVSDVLKNEVVVFDLSSREKLFSFGGRGGSKGKMFGPQGIAIDKKGRIFVAEQFNARVQVFSPEGKHLYMFGDRGDTAFQFEGPRGLAFDSMENLFVAEARKAAILVFSPDGTPLTSLGGGRTTHQLGFTLPTSVFIDRNDRVYISDGMNRRITIWQMLTPDYLSQNPVDREALKEIEQQADQIQKQIGGQ